MPNTYAAIVIAAKHSELIKVKDASGVTNTIGALKCKFEFRTAEWDKSARTAVFCKGNMATHPNIVETAISVPLDSIDECAVPAEVLVPDAKYFSVGVWGITDDGLRIVSKWLVFRVEDGCYVDSTEPIKPTPSVYEQIMLSLNSKAPVDHKHDDIYYKKEEIDEVITGIKPGIQAQSDWLQTDPAATDYIKNKPFYENITGEIIELVPQTEYQQSKVNADLGIESSSLLFNLPTFFEFTQDILNDTFYLDIRHKYINSENEEVEEILTDLDGTPLVDENGDCIPLKLKFDEDIGIIYIGDISIFSDPYNGFKWCLVILDAENLIFFTNKEDEYKLKFAQFKVNIDLKQIDRKFLDTPYTVDEDNNAIFENDIIINNDQSITNNLASIVEELSTKSVIGKPGKGAYAEVFNDMSNKAEGIYSHAEGMDTVAKGPSSHVEGFYTIASGAQQHVQGRFNIEDKDGKYAHIVGDGSTINSRRNGHTIDWKGNGWFRKNIYIGGKSQDDVNAKLVATEEMVREYAAPISNLSTDLEADRENADKYPNVRDILQYIDNKEAVKTISEPCHIADLDVGTYLVKGNPLLNGESQGKVTFINVEDVKEGSTDDFVVNDDYMCLYDGLLSITYKHVDTDDIRESAMITFCSVGFHKLPNTDTTYSNAFTVYGMITNCFKPTKDTPEIVEPIKLNHWYSMTETVLGTYAIHSDISAFGVYDYIDNLSNMDSAEETMDAMAEIGLITPVALSSGEIITASNGEIYTL